MQYLKLHKSVNCVLIILFKYGSIMLELFILFLNNSIMRTELTSLNNIEFIFKAFKR